jgi:predicted nucleotidyltransferase
MTAVADLDRDEILNHLRGLEPALRARGVTSLAIFGSRSRGDYRADSDLDVLVTVKEGMKFSLIDLVGLSHIIGDEIGIRTNMFMKRSLDATMATTIRPDIVEVF